MKLAHLAMLLSLTIVLGCENAEMQAIRSMPINHVDLAKVKDGDFLGAFSYGGFKYVVRTNVVDHKFVDIIVLQNRKTHWAKRAEGVVKRILDQQKNDVDAVSGATISSKALLKAVERALAKGE